MPITSVPIFTSLELLKNTVLAWKTEQLTVGFTCGAFDLLHAGHLDYLEKARTLCDRLIVAVNSDGSVRSYKNPLRPIIAEQHRLHLISGLRCVDAALLMEETRPAKLIELLQPDLYIKGGDYGAGQLRSASLVESYGGRCELIPVKHEISTTAIVKRIELLGKHALPEPVASAEGRPLVLLDRDGTLIENVHFLNSPSKVKLLPGVGEGLRLLQDRGYTLAVVTNQGGIGLGYFDYESFVAANSEMLRQLSPYEVQIARFYFCPHSASDGCRCRKPGPALIERALLDFKASPADCWMIGDAPGDVEAALAAGCRGVLISPNSEHRGQDTARLFLQAVDQILAKESEFSIS